MALILCLETSASICSVALFRDSELLYLKEENKKNSHAELLHVFIEDAFLQSGIEKSNLDAIAISEGPGSYTGLRIGTSTAKGISYALNIPLISVDTLAAMANGVDKEKHDLFIPMQDARRMEVYTCTLNDEFKKITDTHALIVEPNSFDSISEKSIAFFGDGAEKCQESLTHLSNAHFYTDIIPSAKYMGVEALKKFNSNIVEDTAYFVPFYLKDFVAGKPKKLI